MKLNEHVSHFIPSMNSMMEFGMYAFVNKVSKINWNCLIAMKKLCGEDRLVNADTRDRIIANTMIVWFEILAFLVLSDILWLSSIYEC